MTSISFENRVLFVHVPKAAGSVMERLPWVGGRGHQPAMLARRSVVPGGWEYLFKFAFVRNPLDRLVSSYFHFVQKPVKPDESSEYQQTYQALKAHHALHADAPLEGFPEFVLTDKLEELMRTINHFRPQVYFVCDPEGHVILDFVGRVEQLDKDWEEVCRRAGQEHTQLPRTNVTRHRPWGDYYPTLELRRRVLSLYYWDVDVFYPELWNEVTP